MVLMVVVVVVLVFICSRPTSCFGGGGSSSSSSSSSSDLTASTVHRHQIAKKNLNFKCKTVIFFSHYQQFIVLRWEANTNHVKPCRSLRLVAFCFVYH